MKTIRLNPALPENYRFKGAKPGEEVEVSDRDAKGLLNLTRAGIPFALEVPSSVEDDSATSAEEPAAPDGDE